MFSQIILSQLKGFECVTNVINFIKMFRHQEYKLIFIKLIIYIIDLSKISISFFNNCFLVLFVFLYLSNYQIVILLVDVCEYIHSLLRVLAQTLPRFIFFLFK